MYQAIPYTVLRETSRAQENARDLTADYVNIVGKTSTLDPGTRIVGRPLNTLVHEKPIQDPCGMVSVYKLYNNFLLDRFSYQHICDDITQFDHLDTCWIGHLYAGNPLIDIQDHDSVTICLEIEWLILVKALYVHSFYANIVSLRCLVQTGIR